jgi:hypothetical protein
MTLHERILPEKIPPSKREPAERYDLEPIERQTGVGGLHSGKASGGAKLRLHFANATGKPVLCQPGASACSLVLHVIYRKFANLAAIAAIVAAVLAEPHVLRRLAQDAVFLTLASDLRHVAGSAEKFPDHFDCPPLIAAVRLFRRTIPQGSNGFKTARGRLRDGIRTASAGHHLWYRNGD